MVGRPKGHKLSDETREKISTAKTGIPFTDEHKEALKNGHAKKRNQSIEAIDTAIGFIEQAIDKLETIRKEI